MALLVSIEVFISRKQKSRHVNLLSLPFSTIMAYVVNSVPFYVFSQNFRIKSFLAMKMVVTMKKAAIEDVNVTFEDRLKIQNLHKCK